MPLNLLDKFFISTF